MLEFSQTTFGVAVLQIADSVGLSADPEMLTRATTSLNAGIKHFNSRAKWAWLWTEASPIQVIPPFSVTGITASGGAASAAAPAGHGLLVDDYLQGYGFANSVRVTATAASSFGFSLASTGFVGTATANITAGRDSYAVPADFKVTFTAKLVGTNNVLRQFNRRIGDRSNENEQTASTPGFYDVFALRTTGKLRLIPAPAVADTLLIRYHRAMATASAFGTAQVTTANVSALTATLDIPADYDQYLIAWAKWHFLTDKGEERKAQASTWFALAQEGLLTMKNDQAVQPDEAVQFIPSYADPNYQGNVNSTRDLGWSYAGGW